MNFERKKKKEEEEEEEEKLEVYQGETDPPLTEAFKLNNVMLNRP